MHGRKNTCVNVGKRRLPDKGGGVRTEGVGNQLGECVIIHQAEAIHADVG